MPKTAIAAVAFAAALLTGAPSHRAAADGYSAPVRTIHYAKRPWHQRHYWRWDHRPIWDDPWEVLRPTIWGSAEPHFVPADIWARKWRPTYLHRWHRWARRRDP